MRMLVSVGLKIGGELFLRWKRQKELLPLLKFKARV